MSKDVLDVLLQHIDEERVRMVEDIGEGKAKDYAQYQFAAGVIRGLLIAQRHIMDLAKRLEIADE